MKSGVTNEEIEVDLRLSFIKPLHATWLINLYKRLTSREGKRHIAKGWEKASTASVVNGKPLLRYQNRIKHHNDNYKRGSRGNSSTFNTSFLL